MALNRINEICLEEPGWPLDNRRIKCPLSVREEPTRSSISVASLHQLNMIEWPVCLIDGQLAKI